MFKTLVVLLIAVLLALGCIFPQYGEQEDNNQLEEYKLKIGEISQKGSTPFPVMTFNMRLDMEEDDHNNHFTKRIYRIDIMLSKWNPYIIGLQEPFAGQLLHLQSIIPKHYKEIGYNRSENDLGHFSRHHDFNVAILYDSRELELLESDYLWLSSTPKVENSKSWGSGGIRCLNIARFRHITTGAEIVAMNTHLDRWGELARREQASLVRNTIQEWKVKYPDAIFLLFGDFNTAPGQAAHKTLTKGGETIMKDTWEYCLSLSSCSTNSFSSSFHGWQGTLVNTYVARVLQFIVFTFHGLGLSPPINGQTWKDVAYDFVFNRFPLYEAIPTFPRMHVDWILFSGTSQFEPAMVSVVDVKSANFSSDHFPIISLFQINK